MPVETLLQCDGVTLTIDRVPEGKFKVRSGTSSIETTIKADEVLEVRYRSGSFTCCAGRDWTIQRTCRPIRTPTTWVTMSPGF